MQFKIVNKMVANIIESIQSSAIVAVSALKTHTFSSKVTNFPKNQKINGEVSVINQKEISNELIKLKRILLEFQNSVVKKKYPKSIRVDNFPKQKEIKFPKAFEVSNFPKTIKVSNSEDFKEVEISNQPINEIKDVLKEIKALAKLIKKIKLDPKINVSPARLPEINVPEPKVTIKKDEFDYERFGKMVSEALFTDKADDYLSVRLSDGEKFYEAISELTTVSSSGSASSFAGADGTPQRALVNSSRELIVASQKEWESNAIKKDSANPNITYICSENSDGKWMITRLQEDGDDLEKRFATAKNNDGIDSYVAAYNDRESLTYTIWSLA